MIVSHRLLHVSFSLNLISRGLLTGWFQTKKKQVEKFRRSLREIKDISKFKSLDKSLVHEMDKVFSGDIPKLMEKAARPGNR